MIGLAIMWGTLPTDLKVLVICGYLFACFAVVWGICANARLAFRVELALVRAEHAELQAQLASARAARMAALLESTGVALDRPVKRDDRPS